jgi:Lipocalin-like domain
MYRLRPWFQMALPLIPSAECRVLFLDTNESVRAVGEHPTGYLQYSPGGHVVVFVLKTASRQLSVSSTRESVQLSTKIEMTTTSKSKRPTP